MTGNEEPGRGYFYMKIRRAIRYQIFGTKDISTRTVTVSFQLHSCEFHQSRHDFRTEKKRGCFISFLKEKTVGEWKVPTIASENHVAIALELGVDFYLKL